MNRSLSKYLLRRRKAAPQAVHQLWDAVIVLKNSTNKNPSFDNIAQYVMSTHSIQQEDFVQQLEDCVRDNLLLVKKSKKPKGGKSGPENDVYKLPEAAQAEKLKEETHDWYCFKCNLPGDVILCTSCHRVYSCSCLPQGTVSDHYVCDVCKECNEDNSLSDLPLKKLNRILSFICQRLQGKFSSLNSWSEFLKRSVYAKRLGALVDVSTDKESWRIPFLVFKPLDLNTMKAYTKEQKYKNVSEFLVDARSIVHSIVIFHGDQSNQAVTARCMLRTCMSEVEEMKTCPSCYERSLLKLTKIWFCKPCRPPHRLVYSGDPSVPAKVLQEKDGQLLLTFFGNDHPRSLVHPDSTLPIDTPSHRLNQPGSDADKEVRDNWSKAMNELNKHRELMEQNLPPSSSDEESNSPQTSRGTPKVSNLFSPVKESPTTPTKDPTERLGVDAEKSVGSKRRGRPRVEDNSSPSKPAKKNAAAAVKESPDKSKRGRGRPRKLEPPEKKKRRGEPRQTKPVHYKEEDEEDADVEEDDDPEKEEEEEEQASDPVPIQVKTPESPKVSAKNVVEPKNEEEIVSSSCTEPQVRPFGTQTTDNGIVQLTKELEELRAELKALKEAHVSEIAATKKKQWCYNCDEEAIYHCCWNTAYCSTNCQQDHWQKEHKRVCRRKR